MEFIEHIEARCQSLLIAHHPRITQEIIEDTQLLLTACESDDASGLDTLHPAALVSRKRQGRGYRLIQTRSIKSKRSVGPVLAFNPNRIVSPPTDSIKSSQRSTRPDRPSPRSIQARSRPLGFDSIF